MLVEVVDIRLACVKADQEKQTVEDQNSFFIPVGQNPTKEYDRRCPVGWSRVKVQGKRIECKGCTYKQEGFVIPDSKQKTG